MERALRGAICRLGQFGEPVMTAPRRAFLSRPSGISVSRLMPFKNSWQMVRPSQPMRPNVTRACQRPNRSWPAAMCPQR